MSSKIPDTLYPVVVVQDRYQGVYSGGAWLCVAAADTMEGQLHRASWVLTFGPGSDDLIAAMFWATAPSWIASGRTPELAIDSLLAKVSDHTLE